MPLAPADLSEANHYTDVEWSLTPKGAALGVGVATGLVRHALDTHGFHFESLAAFLSTGVIASSVFAGASENDQLRKHAGNVSVWAAFSAGFGVIVPRLAADMAVAGAAGALLTSSVSLGWGWYRAGANHAALFVRQTK